MGPCLCVTQRLQRSGILPLTTLPGEGLQVRILCDHVHGRCVPACSCAVGLQRPGVRNQTNPSAIAYACPLLRQIYFEDQVLNLLARSRSTRCLTHFPSADGDVVAVHTVANMRSPRHQLARWHRAFLDPIQSEELESDGRPMYEQDVDDHPRKILQSPPTGIASVLPANMFNPGGQANQSTQTAPTNTHRQIAPSQDYNPNVYYRFHSHSLSDSVASSTDSSPSTVDDNSATEPSPGSSPESPPPAEFPVGMLHSQTLEDSAAPFFALQKQPPAKKGRNLKSLAVVTSRHPIRAASTTSLPLQPPPAMDDMTSIASPAFVKPPSPPKRKPSSLGLTLLTPGSGKAPPQEIKLTVPATPAFIRPSTLRHFQSSPSLPLFPHRLGKPGNDHSLTLRPRVLDTIASPVDVSEQATYTEEPEEEQNFDVPLSREEKLEAYPEGPICVYEPLIDLYLEPTADQCRQYDVIMNVASEVRNPLANEVPTVSPELEIRIDGGGGIQFAPKRRQPQTALAVDSVPPNDSSPTTPKATPLNSRFESAARSTQAPSEPEYIHIPWEHKSDIVPDLLRLVKLIDDKVKQGKRVLIHCQCGVSRSASLVVAYGLYKTPTMSVQEAYDAVKAKSKWIGPNMNLIMQLQEFRTSLARGGLLSSTRGMATPITPSSAFTEWRGPFSTQPTELMPNLLPSSAGLPTSATVSNNLHGVSNQGPSSAPSGLRWPIADQAPPLPPLRARAASTTKATAYVDTSGHLVPVVTVAPPEHRENASAKRTDSKQENHHTLTLPIPTLTSPRSTEFAMTPLQPSQDADSADSYGIMSPSTGEFPSPPFDRPALLASLGMGSVQNTEAVPRRTLSLRPRAKPHSGSDPAGNLDPLPSQPLRAKISSPSFREQRQLQHLRAILPHRVGNAHDLATTEDALLSPRATEFTKNPFALLISEPASPTQGQEAPNALATADPRSPAQTGVSPITRSIMDVL